VTIRPKIPIAATVGLLALVLAAPAGAHVTLQPSEAPAGGFARLDVRVPNERDQANTTKVVVQFPPGFLSASTEPVPGWDIEVAMRKLDKPVEQFGEQVNEEVGQISFTADEGAAIGPGEFQDFGLSMAIPDKPNSSVTFKALQTYSNGEVVRWIGPPDSDEPAPQVELAAAEEEGAAQEPPAQQPAASGGEDDGGGSDVLAIVALVVGVLGLATGAAALLALRRGRSRTVSAS
jgi:periplasmic copper chaperone A